jgi:transcriptional regulator with XRE-family HTH domain
MAISIDVVLGKRLRARRRLLGLTQQDVADACGVSFQQIQKYEHAVSRVSAAMLWGLAGALDVEVAYFFDGLSPRETEDSTEDRRYPIGGGIQTRSEPAV